MIMKKLVLFLVALNFSGLVYCKVADMDALNFYMQYRDQPKYIEDKLKDNEFTDNLIEQIYDRDTTKAKKSKSLKDDNKRKIESEFSLKIIGRGGDTGASILLKLLDVAKDNEYLYSKVLRGLGVNGSQKVYEYLLGIAKDSSSSGKKNQHVAIDAMTQDINVYNDFQRSEIYNLLLKEINGDLREDSNYKVKQACVVGLMSFIHEDSLPSLYLLKKKLENQVGASEKNREEIASLLGSVDQTIDCLEMHKKPVPPGVILLN